MKVTKEHYELLKTQIYDAVKKNNQNLSHKDFVTEWDKMYSDYTETRKLWDLYWQSGGNKWKKIAFDGNTYGGDYKDSHITTAIKKIYKEIGA
jgi:hypothetical protein